MKCAAVVPTRDRPETLFRALRSFAEASDKAGLDVATVVVSDDSSLRPGISGAKESIEIISTALPSLSINYVPPGAALQPDSRSPGDTRNRGLQFLRASGIEHDAVLMFDDDISYENCIYQGVEYQAGGFELLAEIALQPLGEKVIVGCEYQGRQDLALVEHIILHAAAPPGSSPAASCSRGEIALEAPGGISGAFLFVPACVEQLPPFLHWYNEDYFWLRRMLRTGWSLRRSSHCLVHAPVDGLRVSYAGLMFQQYGEALWCASSGLQKDASRNELVVRARNSVADRIEELAVAYDAVASQRDNERNRTTADTLAKARSSFLKLLETLQPGDGREASDAGFVSDLERIARYCGT